MTNEGPMDSPTDQPFAATPPMPNGQPISETASSAPDHHPPADHPHDGLLHSRGAVLGFLFLVAGVVGLPLLWVNPKFSHAERVFWTVIVLLYTSTLLILFGGMLWWIYRLIIGA